MKIPTTLKHKPVIIVENYSNVDARQAYDSDAVGLSVGLAQWNDRGKVEASAKIWRYTGDKWSRQSEEMPLNRVLDLSILVARTLYYLREEGYRYPKYYNPENPQIDRIGIQGDAMTVEVCVENPNLDEDIQLLANAVAKDGELLGERLSLLRKLLTDLDY